MWELLGVLRAWTGTVTMRDNGILEATAVSAVHWPLPAREKLLAKLQKNDRQNIVPDRDRRPQRAGRSAVGYGRQTSGRHGAAPFERLREEIDGAVL